MSVEESHELILLEAEYVVLNIEDWEEEHPKFVRAVHDWVERGYNQALSEGKQTSRLDVLRSIMLEFYADNNGADQEPDELLQTMALIEGEYEVADELENLRIVEGGYPELRRRVLATVGSQT